MPPAAFCASVACGCATKAWTSRRWAWAARRAVGDHPQSRRSPGLRRVRHVHRHLPGGRADQRHVSLPDATLGNAISSTVCTHCSNGCKTTLSVRNHEILRANNRDLSGFNNDFLCAKGRFGFDFTNHPERMKQPLVRRGTELDPHLGRCRARLARRASSRCTTPAVKTPSVLSARTAPPMKKIICCGASRARPLAPTISIITAPPTIPAW